MVVKRKQLPYDVVTGARRRIQTAFDNGVKIYLSISGGKDSICLAHLVHSMIKEGRIDPTLLTVRFIDEEAIYADVERIARLWRKRFLAEGVTFQWYCVEVRHHNCFNQLSQDMSFICWDSTKSDVWVRPMPPFAVTYHPQLRRRQDTYQKFMQRVSADGIQIAGVRNSESIQRLNAFAKGFKPGISLLQPIYDWKDTDIWRYIDDHDLEFPDTYMQMYQLGYSRRDMRISQFFSIDTAKSLTQMAEHNPGLMERVIRREPNAYLASLYWDSEMFRRVGGSGQGGDGGQIDYRQQVLTELARPREERRGGASDESYRLLRSFIIRRGFYMSPATWKKSYGLLIGGDPKNRTLRAIISATHAGET